MAATLLALLGTWLIHGTLLLGAAWLVTARLAHPRLRELLWKSALVGSLLTTGLQAGLGGPFRVEVGALAMAGIEASTRADDFDREGPSGVEASRSLEAEDAGLAAASEGRAEPADPLALTGEPIGLAAGAESPGTWSASGLSGPGLLVGFWLAAAGFGLVRLALQARTLGRLLAGSHAVTAADLGLARRDLGRPAARLRLCPALTSPMAVGRRTVLLPTYVAELEPAQRRALLSHELEHLRRRDGAWLLFTSLLVALAPVQPLLYVARRHLRRDAELLCDEAAARAAGGLDLARCLALVAERHDAVAGPSHRAPAWAAAMAGPPSELVQRVERALGRPVALRRDHLLGTMAGTAVLVILVACAGPGLQAREGQQPGTSSGNDAGTLVGVSETARMGSVVELDGVSAIGPVVYVDLLRRPDAQATRGEPELDYVVDGIAYPGDATGRADLVEHVLAHGARTGSLLGLDLRLGEGIRYHDTVELVDELILAGIVHINLLARTKEPLPADRSQLRLRGISSRPEPGLPPVNGIVQPSAPGGGALRPDYRPVSTWIQIDEDGAVSYGDEVLLEAGSTEDEPLTERLAELGDLMIRGHVDGYEGLEVAIGTLGIQAPAGAPFSATLRVLTACADFQVLIPRTGMLLERLHDDAPEYFVTDLPTDAHVVVEEVLEEEGEEEAAEPPARGRFEVHLDGDHWTLSLTGPETVSVEARADAPLSWGTFREVAWRLNAVYPRAPVVIEARPSTTVGQAAELLGLLTEAGLYDRWSFVAPYP